MYSRLALESEEDDFTKPESEKRRLSDLRSLLDNSIQALAFIVGVLFVVEGIIKLTYSWHWRSQPKIGWIVVSGILSIAIAAILLSGWPQQSAAL
ncbi:Short repeat of unknown function [Nitrosomonas sp. Nm51]|uniref:DUF308 domain-containing protein n=1 Tax=Nitrosomonas sp. Nm51 TaxID=133720 RepID=UPI0008AD06D9|nr:Short repeat of unknown function [Nitrosomonas sp. Nm51]